MRLRCSIPNERAQAAALSSLLRALSHTLLLEHRRKPLIIFQEDGYIPDREIVGILRLDESLDGRVCFAGWAGEAGGDFPRGGRWFGSFRGGRGS